MHFYRILKPFYAITLDLDNTLYDNYPIITQAEKKSLIFLKKYHPALHKLEIKDYYLSRAILLSEEPNIYHDVNHWRWKSLKNILLKKGLTKYDALLGADKTMDIILYWRNKIHITAKTHIILSALNTKWPLIAITNGNANPINFGLHKYFYDILIAGKNGRAKPYTDMFRLASKKFGMACKYILHIGDNLITDIQGAKYANMQTCWTYQYHNKSKQLYTIKNTQLFPHLKISKLYSLTYLL